ncbi:unnamed protein product [Cunninghamella echinulata]
MVQTTLFNYFTCNNSPRKSTKRKIQILKQTLLKDYFPTKVKAKKKTILDYFKKKDLDLVLVDIHKSVYSEIKCVKKKLNDKGLKYIAISYRWGELNEQLVKTPDYTAHITSFDFREFINLCYFIKAEKDLKNIQYLWIDAISINQQSHEQKKETILKMSDIYKRATHILAVPDLHYRYLMKNPANRHAIRLVQHYSNTIYEDICKNNVPTFDNEKEKDDIKQAYEFLNYLIDDWSNRAWVMSEYCIAKGKKKKMV